MATAGAALARMRFSSVRYQKIFVHAERRLGSIHYMALEQLAVSATESESLAGAMGCFLGCVDYIQPNIPLVNRHERNARERD
jgi:hypothetical protein